MSTEQVTEQGKHNPGVQHRLGSGQLWGRDLGDKQLHEQPGCCCCGKSQGETGLQQQGHPQRKGIIPLCSVLVRPQLEFCAQFWSLLCKTDVDGLKRGQGRATEMIQ